VVALGAASRPEPRIRREDNDFVMPEGGVSGVVLLATTDPVAIEWAPRWLRRYDLAVHVVGRAEDVVRHIESEQPEVLIVDAPLIAGRASEDPSITAKAAADLPTIILCANNREVRLASEFGAAEVSRRPYDWQLIAERCVRVLDAYRRRAELKRVRRQLREAVSEVVATERDLLAAKDVDGLTDLPTRDRFRDLLEKSMGASSSYASEITVAVIGIERFRRVNNAIGHRLGDAVLRQFADRLKACLQDRDLVGQRTGAALTAFTARLGGVRFALAISNSDDRQIEQLRQALSVAVSTPFEVGGHSIYLNISIGVSVFPRDGESVESVLQSAENAMIEAKLNGSGFWLTRQNNDTRSLRRLRLDAMLRDAVREEQLTLAYQPLLDTQSGRLVGAEALLRWHHPDEGTIPPDEFIPAAEESGMIVEIGAFVIREACRQSRAWLDQGFGPVRIAVNVALCQLVRGNVTATVADALAEHGVDPAMLELEISERGVLNRHPEVIAEIHRLKALGVRISIDDFGTGNAAIGYLKNLPADVIKVDRSYVSGAMQSARDRAIVSGIVALAHGLDAIVIGEGVETTEQLELLRDWGCDECQGFLFSPAVTADEFVAFANRRPR
jgi:diguanylate cyclase (GGDEF)-like protein